MSNTTDDNQNQIDVAKQPPKATTPPIQWPSAATPQTDNDRAAQIARQHVERVYSRDSPRENTPPVAGDQQSHVMRGEQYNWDEYHAAWQQYYHQYFYRYYAGWWQEQKKELEQNTAYQVSQTASSAPVSELSERQKVAKEIREKVRENVEKRADKVKSSSHFKPIMAAISVGLLFLLLNYNQVIVGAVKQYVAPGNVVTTPVIVEPNTAGSVGPEPKIIIPKIGVQSDVVYDEPKVDEASYQKALERGAVRLGNTANPGTKGNVVIGAHSSNNVFNAGKYKYVFVNLRRLSEGDIFYLNFEGKRYTYKITVANKIISPKDVSILAQSEKPMVTLFTCDPPGTNVNRLVVQGEQIDPSPEAAVTNTNQQTKTNKANPLPSVAPSLWDRLLGS